MLLQRQRIPRNNGDFDSKKLTHSPRGGAIEKQEVKHMRGISQRNESSVLDY